MNAEIVATLEEAYPPNDPNFGDMLEAILADAPEDERARLQDETLEFFEALLRKPPRRD